jgi:hypothetical protein
MTLGSDATGDLYYRNSGGHLTRLGVGSGSQVLGVSAGLPAWVTLAGTGTVTSAQLSQGAGITVTTTSGANPCTSTCNLTIAQSLTNVTLQANPAGYASITATTPVMEGAGSTCKLTPAYSGRVQVQFLGVAQNNTAQQRVNVQAVYGTSTAPTQGAAGSGTAIDQAKGLTAATASAFVPLTAGGIVTGLSPGTAYWFDLQTDVTANTGTLSALSCSLMEF